MTKKPQKAAVVVSLVLLNTLVFAGLRHAHFVRWDDDLYVFENPNVMHGLTRSAIVWAFTSIKYFYWQPLTWLSHMLDVQLFGLNPGPHHITNIVIHTINSILLFFLLRRMTGAQWRSAFVAAVFAIHPLRVESVAWIAERKDVLSTMFLMLTLLAYVWYVAKPSMLRYTTTLLCFVLGLMAKPMLVTLPFVLLLLDYWPLARTRKAKWRALVGEKDLLFVAAGVVAFLTVVGQRESGAMARISQASFATRFGNALISYVLYLRDMIWPAHLAPLYQLHQTVPANQVLASALLLLAISAVIIWVVRRPYATVGWLWYLGTLLPVIGLLQAGSQSRADRFTYVPMIGILIIVTWGVAEVLKRRDILMAAAAAVLLGCVVVSRKQVDYWQNGVVLWERVLQVTDQSAVAEHMYGRVLADTGRVDEAIPHYEAAVRLDPGFEEAHNNLGTALIRKGKFEDAVGHFQKAVSLNPKFDEAKINLGLTLSELRRFDEAMNVLRAEITANPNSASAHNALGVVLKAQGRRDEASAEFAAALRLNPQYQQGQQNLAQTHNDQGMQLAQAGKLQEAIVEFEEAIKIDPNYAQAHNNIANAQGDVGRIDDAIKHYREALRIDPAYLNARHNLGLTLAQQGRTAEAIKEFKEILRLEPGNPRAKQMLEQLAH